MESQNSRYMTFGLLIVMALLIMPSTGFGARVTISSLPYTASGSYDTLVISGTKVTGSGDGIVVTGHDLVFDFGSDTLEFGASGGSGYYGMRFTNQCYNIKIIGGTILHGSSSGNSASGLYISYAHDILIQGTDIIVYGTNGHCIASGSVGAPGVYNVEIDGGDYWNNSHGYSSRCMYDGSAIRLWSNTFDGYGEYHYNIHDITIHNSPGQGIMFQGRDQDLNCAKVLVHNNTIRCDARNDMYPSYDGTCHSAANPYAIALLKCAPGSKVYNNIIDPGSTYGGGRGILIENSVGTSNEWIEIYGNTVDVHEGPNVEYGEGGTAVHALRVRAIDGNSIDYVKIYNNTFIASGDANTGTSEYNSSIAVLRYSDYGDTDSIIVKDNTFRAKSLTSGVESLTAVFDYANSGGLVFKGNRIEGDGTLVKFGFRNSGARRITLDSCTMAFLTPSYNTETYHVGHLSNGWDCTDNVSCNAFYENGASETDITFANGGSLELTLQRSLDVFVEGNNGLPVSGATVTAVNNYGRTVLNGTSNANGLFSDIVNYRYESDGSDSTNFNDFSIKVKKGSDSTIVDYTVSATSDSPTLTLENTAGEVGDDSTPPETINDLGYEDATESSVTLTWTVPGDDGSTGTATAYDIRYSTSTINLSNWSSASQVSGEPNPGVSGSSQSYTVNGLSGGETYFFGIRTRDEVHNWSALSNIVSLTVSDQTPPSTVADLNVSPGGTPGSFILEWTAPGDNGSNGTASTYDIRYHTSFITESNWSQSTTVTGEPSPSAAGSDEQHVVSGLEENTVYYFALKTGDENNNWSAISNVVSAGDFSDNTAPDEISDLEAGSGLNLGEIVLSWTAVGDDGTEGTASSYIIRYSDAEITEANWSSAALYPASPTPEVSGQSMDFSLSGLNPGDEYYIALKVRDDNSNISGLSNVVSAVAQYDFSLGGDGLVLSFPPDNSRVKNSKPYLGVANVDDNSSNVYYFQVSISPTFGDLVCADSVGQQAGPTTSWQVTEELTAGETYYWRANVNDDYFTDYIAFTIVPGTHAYPNPFKRSMHENVTFAEVPENSSLIILTVSGSTVKRWSDIHGGEVSWNGTNDSGNPVASGTYLWFVENSEIRGKIVIKE